MNPQVVAFLAKNPELKFNELFPFQYIMLLREIRPLLTKKQLEAITKSTGLSGEELEAVFTRANEDGTQTLKDLGII